MAAAVLTIDINARLTSLEQGLAKVKSSVDATARAMQSSTVAMQASIGGVNNATEILRKQLIGLASIASVGAFVSLIKGAIDSADKLNDLSKFTSIAVETLGGIGFAAQQSGSDLDGAAKAIAKFNLTIGEANAGNKEAIATFKALGISTQDLNNLTADQLLIRTATAFASFEDGADKATLGNRAFKKSYADIASLLDDGGAKLQQNISYFQRYGGVTKDAVQRADEFNDSLAKLTLQVSATVREVTAALLPVLQGIVNVLLKVKEEGNSAHQGLGKLAADGSIKTWAQDAAIAIATIAESLIFVGRAARAISGSFSAVGADLEVLQQSFRGFNPQDLFSGKASEDMRKVLADREKVLADSNARYEKLWNDPADFISAALRKQFDKQATGNAASNTFSDARFDALALAAKRKPAPRFPDGASRAGTTAVDDPARKLLEGQLKAIQATADQERDILKTRMEFLDRYYDANLLSMGDYFAKKQDAQAEDLRVTLAAITSEIALLEQFKSGKGRKQTEIADTDNKIADLKKKAALAEQQAAKQDVLGYFDRRKAASEYVVQLDELNAKLLEIQGNRGAAFDIRQRQQNAGDRSRLSANQDTAGLATLNRLETAERQQFDLTEATRAYSATLDTVGRAEQRISIQREAGNLTELQALGALSSVRAANLAQLTRELDVQQQIAQAMDIGPARDQALAHIDAMRVSLEALAATGDLVAKKFNEIGSSAFSDALQSLANGTKTFKQAALDFGKNITGQINKIAADQISDTLFKGGGALSGFGDFFSKLFGGKGGAGAGAALGSAGATAADTALVTLSTTAVAADASLLALGTTTLAGDTALLALSTTTAVTTTAIAALATAAATASAALAAVGASSAVSGAASGVGSIFGSALGGYAQGGGLAEGTNYWRGGLSLVGERGPELVRLPRGSQVIPNRELRGARQSASTGPVTNHSVTINYQPPPGQSTATTRQHGNALRQTMMNQVARG